MLKISSIKRTIILVLLLAAILSLCSVVAYATDFTDKISEAHSKAQELGSKLNTENIISILTSNITSYVKQLSKSFGIAMAAIIISLVFSAISSESPTGNLFDMISKCFVIISVFPILVTCFEKVSEHIEAVCGFMLSFIPTAVLLHTASGNTLSAAVLSGSTSFSISLLQSASAGIILPLIKAMISLGTVNLLCKKTNLSGISNMLKSVCMWVTGLFFTLFTGILSLQTLLQSSADNLAMKGLKYSAAKFIPIAGGMVSESMKTVITAVGYIKSVSGISGIVFIIYTLIPPLCLILITKLYLSMLSAFSGASGKDELKSFFDSLGGTMNLLLALMISCSISFIILLALFIKTNTSI